MKLLYFSNDLIIQEVIMVAQTNEPCIHLQVILRWVCKHTLRYQKMLVNYWFNFKFVTENESITPFFPKRIFWKTFE